MKFGDNFTVGIATYRNQGRALRVARALLESPDPPARVVVLDDGSPEPISAQALLDYSDLSGLDFIRSDKNLGVFGAYNRLFSRAYPQAEFFLLLDDDACVSASFWEEATGQFSQDPRLGIIGLVGTRVSRDDFDSRLPEASGLSSGRPIGGPFRTHATQLAGYCLAIRKVIFGEVNGFDARFRAFLGDSDFCCRAKLKGWSAIRIAWPCCIHVEHDTLYRHPELKWQNQLEEDGKLFRSLWNGRWPDEVERDLLG